MGLCINICSTLNVIMYMDMLLILRMQNIYRHYNLRPTSSGSSIGYEHNQNDILKRTNINRHVISIST